MQNFHHKTIKRFSLDGVIQDESALGRLKNEYARLLVSEMRICGYVPRIDIDPDFTVDYNEDKQYFEFKISIHGVYAGKRKSKWILGIDVNKPIYIQKSKSKESLRAQV
jgi:hypothetical protein